MSKRVAVIDIGSNSIKSLVAEGDARSLVPVHEETREVRLSRGISGTPPRIGEPAFSEGVQAVAGLWKHCLGTGTIEAATIAATAAVRAAVNGQEFMQSIRKSTGVVPIVLTGEQEAEAIARGVLTDPHVRSSFDAFTLIDLGGGSLELIHYAKGSVQARASLPMGAVRLTEQFIANPAKPIPMDERVRLAHYIREELAQCGVPILPCLVGCSGGLTVLRGRRAGKAGKALAESDPVFTRDYLHELGQEVLSSDLESRIGQLNLPPHRADIFPAAFILFEVLLDVAGTDRIIHSLHNLRFGLAADLLCA